MDNNPDSGTSDIHLYNSVRIAKNSVALFIVAILTKGAGLVVAVLIARYLGPAALGTYAAVMGLSILVENVVPLGQPYIIIREIARDRSRLYSYWLYASIYTLLCSLFLGVLLVVIIQKISNNAEYNNSVYWLVIYLPLAGLYTIAQAVVQGMEQMEQLALSAFLGRVTGLIILWWLLIRGWDVPAAFIAYGAFHLIGLLVLGGAILKKTGLFGGNRVIKLLPVPLHSFFRSSIPFMIQTLSMTALLQLSVLVLPFLVPMETVGIFDAADRVPQTSGMIIPIVALAILPTLSRISITDKENATRLLQTAHKFMQILILPFVFFVAISADQIIELLYGSQYGASVEVLRILIWAQIFFVADSILNQIMMATDNESPMVRRTVLTLVLNFTLLIMLAPRFGALAAAWAVLVTRLFILALDIHFVTRKIHSINLLKPVTRPFLCAALSAGVVLIVHDFGLWITLGIYSLVYASLIWFFKVFNPGDLTLAKQVTFGFWEKVVAFRAMVMKK